MKLENLRDLMVDELRDLYDAEQQIIDALPKMAKAASSDDLRQTFEEHLQQTKNHKRNLEQVFDQLGEKRSRKECVGMKGLIKEGQKLMKEKADQEVLDAGLIAVAQKVEHYEIAGYGTARTYANMLGENQVARTLQQILDEEGETDKKLTRLAESKVNVEAI